MNFEKIKEFFYIVLIAVVVAVLSMQQGGGENYERAIQIGTFVFTFNYLFVATEDVFKIRGGSSVALKIATATGFLAAVTLSSIILSSLIIMVV